MFRGIPAAFGLINFGFGILAFVRPELMAGWIGFELPVHRSPTWP